MKQSNQPKYHRPISHGATWLALLLCLILPIQPALAGKIIYYHNDASGSPVMASDAQGNIIWREHYQPYGEKINEVCPAPCDDLSDYEDIGYTGHEYDAETGLTYMQARYYDPEVGRFLSIDPVGFKPSQPMTFNRYSYANNNPYKFVDPDGRNVTLGLAGLMYESYSAMTGNGFRGDMVLGAFAHGYNGEGGGFVSALTGDLVTAGAAITGGVAAVRTIVAQGIKASARNITNRVIRSIDDPGSLRGTTQSEIKKLIPKNWISKPLKKGNGTRYLNPHKKGESIMIEKGFPNAKDPLHQGAYVKISRNGKVTRIPLKGNPVLK